MTITPALTAHQLTRVYGTGRTTVRACDGVSLEARPGELLVVRGPSGSGKTTLLNLLGGLDVPTAGRVLLGDVELSAMTEDELVEVRRRRIGYVFQSFGLVPILTARENVEVPLRLLEVDPEEREARTDELLGALGLAAHAEQRPYELSGGQQQRVALARAFVCEPEVLIADEPTGQLDLETGRSILELMRQVVHQQGMIAVVATHDPALIDQADRVLELRDGRLADAPEPA